MKLSELAQKPRLEKITITSETLVEKYGDELDFFIYDRQPIDIFTKLADVTESGIVIAVNKLLLSNAFVPMDITSITVPGTVPYIL